jgi:hypothetical protein
MMAHPLPKKIVQTPGLLVILHERNMEFRQIFTDGRPLPDDQNPSWSGYSSGKWDKDTLVTERFRRAALGRPTVEMTIDDPKAYTRPWTIQLNQHIALDADLLEYACLENEKDVAHFPGNR